MVLPYVIEHWFWYQVLNSCKLLLPLGCISLRLSQSGEERCGTALKAILSNFYLPCTDHSNTAETYALWCVPCPSLVSLLKSYTTSIQDATSLLKTSPNTGEARAATGVIVRDKTTLPCKTLWLCFLNWQPFCSVTWYSHSVKKFFGPNTTLFVHLLKAFCKGWATSLY